MKDLCELQLHNIDEDFDVETQGPSQVLDHVAALVISATAKMNSLWPDDDHMVFVRLPFVEYTD